MTDEEERPRPRQAPDLARLGVEELEDYIADLQAEIARARAMVDSKKAHRGDADSLFRR